MSHEYKVPFPISESKNIKEFQSPDLTIMETMMCFLNKLMMMTMMMKRTMKPITRSTIEGELFHTCFITAMEHDITPPSL